MSLFNCKESLVGWEMVPVKLTDDGVQLVSRLLIEEGLPVGGFGGAITTLRIIEKVARAEFGPILTDERINPLSADTLRYLIGNGKLALDKATIEREYKAHKESQLNKPTSVKKFPWLM